MKEVDNPVKSFGVAKGLNPSKYFDRIRFRDVAGLVGAVAILLFVIGVSSVSYKLHKESTEALDNHARVEENSELEYYLVVKSDGVDKNGTQSTDSTTANIGGGITTVTDKIPAGLEFVGFKTTETGTIGAVARSDSATSCSGHVIDDTKEETTESGTWNTAHTEYYYHGLHYNAETRTVSFKAENIQAGCDLTVGIVTKTPTLGSNTRLDFYNTAKIDTTNQSMTSNTLHSWIGKSSTPTYDVTYSYAGNVPDGAPVAPVMQKYSENSSVSVEQSPSVDGYQFSGWTTGDAVVSSGSFTMPASSVAFTGSFTEKPAGTKYSVTYVIDGEKPADYVVPKTKQYEAGKIIPIDSLSENKRIDNFTFSGWSSEDVEVYEKGFLMPARNVEIHGSFTQDTYKVTYAFEGDVLPPNADALLPAEQEYPAGTKVTRAPNPTANGYAFTGWYKNETFIMPEEDVVIYGEWSIQNGVFSPEISKKITNPMKKYGLGDTVKFEITVKNTAGYQIKDIQVLEQLDGAVFQQGNGYTIRTDNYALISKLDAGQSIKLYAVYEVQSGDDQHLTNTAKIAGALADNNYNLDTTKEYLATVSFDAALYGVPYDDTDNANTRDKIISYVLATIVGLGGLIGSIFMIRRTIKNNQLQGVKGAIQKTGKIKNFFNPNTATRGRLLSFAILDLGLIALATGLIVKLNLPQKLAENADPTTISFMSSRANYDAGEGGAWKVTKSAKWTGDGKAQLTIDVNTVAKNMSGKYTDVLFVVDVSGSMDGPKLDKVKHDMTELTDSLLSNPDNRIGIIKFGTDSERVLNFTNDANSARDAISEFDADGGTNYYKAFREAEEMMLGYQQQDDRDLMMLFLTDGYPNLDAPNEQAEYTYLKSVYPYMVINAIQYEMANEILDPIKRISDDQYIANMDTLDNILFEASLSSEFYDSFSIQDMMSKYFNIASLENITVSKGGVAVTGKKGEQVITWDLSGALRSGTTAKLMADIQIDDAYKRVAGNYPTNSDISLLSKIGDDDIESKNSSESPTLRNAYEVKYETGVSGDCELANQIAPETHFVYEVVGINESHPLCADYDFDGYVVIGDDIRYFNDDFFSMPERDVTIRATGTSTKIEKAQEGDVYVERKLYDEIAKKSNGSDSNIDFNALPSAENGDGVNMVDSTKDGEYPVYYYRGAVADNNVIFADFCWLALRTLDTGGTKLIYNGAISKNGNCVGTYGIAGQTRFGETKSSYSYSPTYNGYMRGTMLYSTGFHHRQYEPATSTMNFDENIWFADDAQYDESTKKWTLVEARQAIGANDCSGFVGSYSLASKSEATTGSSIYYIIGFEDSRCRAIQISGNSTIEEANWTITYGDGVTDNGDGTFTISNPTTRERKDWVDYYENLTGKYFCKNAIDNACSNYGYVSEVGLSYLYSMSPGSKRYFSSSFSYSDGKYTLDEDSLIEVWKYSEPSERQKISNARYTCQKPTDTQCSTLYYTNYVSRQGDYSYFFILKNGKSFSEALDDSLLNTNDSALKIRTDDWYETNIKNTENERYIEDTVYCNDRSMEEDNAWTLGGDISQTVNFGAGIRNKVTEKHPNLDCPQRNDAFTVNDEIGNGALTYPIGHITVDELTMAGYGPTVRDQSSNFLYITNRGRYWTMSPRYFTEGHRMIGYLQEDYDSAEMEIKSSGMRPVIAVKPEIIIYKGDGSKQNPWILDAP